MASLLKRFSQTYKHSDTPSLLNRVILITGGSNGIGLSLSRTLYAHGANLHLLSESQDNARRAIEYIKTGDLKTAPQDYQDGFGSQKDESGAGAQGVDSDSDKGSGSVSGSVEWEQCDLSDLNQVARVAKSLAEKLDRLDGVYFIAGIGVNEFKLTKDGYDSHLTINNLSHHLLLSHLFPLLEKTASLPTTDVRIISMSSELHRATFGGPSPTFGGGKFASTDEFKQDVGQSNLYARTKLAVQLFTKAVVQRHIQSQPTSSSPASKILAFSTHPGAVATGQQSQFKPAYGEVLGSVMGAVVRPFMSRPDQGAISALWAGVSGQLRTESDSEGGKLKFENGSYFTEAEEEGGETKEASDQELIDNFYINSEKVIQDATAGKGLGPWHANANAKSA